MKKILFLITILLPLGVWAQKFSADITINGSKKPAEFMVTNPGECKLGNGLNSCISPYSEGFVSIPSEVTYNGGTFKVKEINRFAFRLCSKITSVNIPEGVTRVGEFAFQGGEFMVMRCKHGLGAELALVSAEFQHRPCDRHAVKGGGASPDLVENQQGLGRGVL